MFYYINNNYKDGHVDYIESPRQLNLTRITKEEYNAAIAAIREGA